FGYGLRTALGSRSRHVWPILDGDRQTNRRDGERRNEEQTGTRPQRHGAPFVRKSSTGCELHATLPEYQSSTEPGSSGRSKTPSSQTLVAARGSRYPASAHQDVSRPPTHRDQ